MSYILLLLALVMIKVLADVIPVRSAMIGVSFSLWLVLVGFAYERVSIVLFLISGHFIELNLVVTPIIIVLVLLLTVHRLVVLHSVHAVVIHLGMLVGWLVSLGSTVLSVGVGVEAVVILIGIQEVFLAETSL